MAAWYPVKAGGTRVAGFESTWPTGSFASHGASFYYDSYAAVYAADSFIGADEFVIFSHLHSETSATTLSIRGSSNARTRPGHFYSVDDANMDQLKVGAVIEQTSSILNMYYGLVAYGLTISALGSYINIDSSGNDMRLIDCTLIGNDSSKGIQSYGACSVYFYNCTLSNTHASPDAAIRLNEGASFEMYNTTFSGNATSIMANNSGNSQDGMRLVLDGCDLTTMTGTMFDGIATTSSWGIVDIRLFRCKTPAVPVYVSGDWKGSRSKLEVIECGNVSADCDDQYYRHGLYGDVTKVTDIYRNESPALTSSGNRAALKFEGVTAQCTPGTPITHELTQRFHFFTQTDKQKVRIYLACQFALDAMDVYIDAVVPQATNKHKSHVITSRYLNIHDPVNAPGLVTDNGSDWRNGAGGFSGWEYYIDIDTSILGASDGPAYFFLHVGTTQVVYVDPVMVSMAA